MNKLVDKQVRMNLVPFKRSPFMLEAFSMAAGEQGWTKTEIELAINQTNGLSLDGKYDVLRRYCTTFGEEVQCSQSDVQFLLSFLGEHAHYLNKKPIVKWDEHDSGNFDSLKRKATRSLRAVFAHFPGNMKEENKYDSQFKPDTYFETHEEALEAVPVGQESNVNIYALWITN